ncbi:hypothetical protein N7456_005241 [Penicillium angulare]|uniref:Uncharacterized protein n=1 Tax=Penicillium angulare TaxID=116970 RepID=A0A9W9FXY8_9EURO|nr:hypothetical protein N7456_005241 [Penicillium angulare]
MAPSNSSQPCGLPGVSYTKFWASKTGEHWGALAGSFNKASSIDIPNTEKLFEETLKKAAVRNVVEQFMESASNNHGYSPEEVPPYPRKIPIMQAKDPKWMVVFEDSDRPTVGINGVIKANISELSLVWYDIQCMKAAPKLCKQSQVSRSPYYLDPYDIFHWSKFLTKCVKSFREKGIDAGLEKLKMSNLMRLALRAIWAV